MEDVDFTKRKSSKRFWFGVWTVLWPITAALLIYPISTTTLRIGVLLTLLGVVGGLVMFCWSKKAIRSALLLVIVAFCTFFALPGRDFNSDRLRKNYIDALAYYEGSKYVWGGENKVGIDCSGLVRAGLIRANYEQGLRTLNPALMREGLSLWWHDSSAQALGEEYRQRTRRLLTSPSINELDHSKILPGDIAVTTGGGHTLAYVGEKTWIEADPNAMKVIKVQVPAKDPWFEQPVNIMRWVQLSGEKSAPAE